MGAAANLNFKEQGNVGEARFGGNCGVEVGLPVRGDMRILHVKSYRRVGLAASGEIRIF